MKCQICLIFQFLHSSEFSHILNCRIKFFDLLSDYFCCRIWNWSGMKYLSLHFLLLSFRFGTRSSSLYIRSSEPLQTRPLLSSLVRHGPLTSWTCYGCRNSLSWKEKRCLWHIYLKSRKPRSSWADKQSIVELQLLRGTVMRYLSQYGKMGHFSPSLGGTEPVSAVSLQFLVTSVSHNPFAWKWTTKAVKTPALLTSRLMLWFIPLSVNSSAVTRALAWLIIH